MKRLVLSFLLVLALAGFTQAAEVSVPASVSQGHAFPVSVSDAAPFEAVFTWRGEQFHVKAVRGETSPAMWKAELLLAMPIDARGRHTVALSLNGEKRTATVTAIAVPWPQSILKVAPKYVEPPRELQ